MEPLVKRPYAKLKAIHQRYNSSEKGKARGRRYCASKSGAAIKTQRNRRRMYIGYTYVGSAKTTEEAERINAHIKARLSAFKSRFSSDPGMEADS